MSYFDNAHHFTINKAQFTNNNVATAGMTELYQYVARGASHNTKAQDDAPKCHEDTRTQLLGDILHWIKLPKKETGIMLLHGPAGAGKSCIARSVCQQAATEGLLGASFFFWRSDSDRNKMDKLFTTIAHQLANANNNLRPHILTAIEQNPDIVDKPLEYQFRTLIFQPCLKVTQEELHFTAIVIDGLDECTDQMMQVSILNLLARIVRYEGFPLGFFITCRPELHLQEVFNTKDIVFSTQIISLDGVAGVSQDIRTVLQSGFSRVLNDPRFKMALKSVPRPWPSPQSIETLVDRSSGQFIYAATVLKFISSPDHNPEAQLDIVLGIRNGDRSTSPLADLDRLYYEILSRVKNLITMKQSHMRAKKGDDHACANAIIEAVNYNQHRLLLVVELLLDIPQGEAYLSLNQLHSLIHLNVGSVSFKRKLKIEFYHRSFEDFLNDTKRSRNFYLHKPKIHADIFWACLKFISCTTFETFEQHIGWIYVYFLWARHFGSGLHTGHSVNFEEYDFAMKKLFVELPHSYLHATQIQKVLDTFVLLNEDCHPIAVTRIFKSLANEGLLTEKNFRDAIYFTQHIRVVHNVC
ncbi:hypothetical protein BDQ17DRAFT_1361729 [Cyathus striatus]|nr:hypothetical protein BDQ17DRAFT_1361729 [Cyathus striatus]